MAVHNPLAELDNSVIGYIGLGRLRIVTRNESVIQQIRCEFVCNRLVESVTSRGLTRSYSREEMYTIYRRKNFTEIDCAYGLVTWLLRICQQCAVRLTLVDDVEKREVSNALLAKQTEFVDTLGHLNTLRDWQQSAIDCMRNLRMGRFSVSTGAGKSHLIGLFCAVAVHSRILVTTASIGDIKDLHKRITSFGVQSALIHGSSKGDPSSRVVCCSVGSLMRVADQVFDYMIGDECHTHAAPASLEKLELINRARSFGVSANHGDRQDKADPWIESMYGPVILSRSYSQNQQAGDVAPIKVKFVNSITYKSTLSKMLAIRERVLVIDNEARNKQIATEAIKCLKQGLQVLILVRTSEHCLRVHKECPEAVPVFLGISKERLPKLEKEGLLVGVGHTGYTNNKVSEIQREFKEGRIRCVVANSVWHKGKDFPDLDVLIRADASGTPILSTQLSGRLSRITDTKKYGLLIDFKDEFDKSLKARARKRRNFYLSQGWQIDGSS